MPTTPGVPINNGASGPFYVGPLHPYNWIDISGQEVLGITQSSQMRGQPAAFDPQQSRQFYGPRTIPQPVPAYLQSRPYSRGAGAFAPKFGVLPINPIGAGVYAPYRLPTIAGPGARYEFGAIWFGVQATPTSMRMNPTVPIETVDALIATSYVAAMYPTTG